MSQTPVWGGGTPSAQGTLLPGESATFTATYALEQADVDAGGVSNIATGTGTPPDGTPITDPSDPAVTPVTPASGIETTKTQTVDVTSGLDPAAVDAGDVITYEIVIANTGNVTLNTVSVADDTLTQATGSAPPLTLTSGPDFVSNSGVGGGTPSAQGTLLPGESATFTATYALEQADVDAGGVSNIATGTGTPPDGTPITDPSDPAVTPVTPASGIETTKTQTVDVTSGLDPAAVDAGDVITYEIVIANTGNVTLNTVSVADDTLTQATGSAPPLTLTSGPDFVSNSGVGGGTPSAQGTLLPGESATFTATYALEQADVDAGGVSNIATGTGTPPDGTPITDPSDPAVTPVTPASGIETTKTQTVDVTSGLDPAAVDAGDVITYEIVIANTGNVTLNTVSVADDTLTQATGSAPPLTLTSGPDFVSNSGVGGGTPSAQGTLLPGESATFTATYALEQADVDAGGVSNIATGTGTPPDGTPITDPSDPAVTPVASRPALKLTKELTSTTKLFPYVYEFVYRVSVENTGNVTHNSVRVQDDVAAALTPGTIVGTPALVISGFGGSPSVNAAYNGSTISETLSGAAVLAPGNIGVVEITVRASFTAGFPPASQGNTAFGSSDELPGPVASDDPGVTPDDETDVNPTLVSLADADGDGAPDGNESSSSDRDGDGVADANDYDPTGYFYCEETGGILPGGLITVTGPAGAQIGLGTSSYITILRDGSTGEFQFTVSATGPICFELCPAHNRCCKYGPAASRKP